MILFFKKEPNYKNKNLPDLKELDQQKHKFLLKTLLEFLFKI